MLIFAQEDEMPDLKFSVDKVFDQNLKDLVKSNPDAENEADVVQRAVATYKYLRKDLPPGAKIQIVGPNNDVLENDLKIP
jgi:hypothetical protein